MTDDGPGNHLILGTFGRAGLNRRIIWGRESPETLTCFALALFYDVTDPYECQPESWADPPDYEDEDYAEVRLDRTARDGWTHCEDCGEWLHLNDVCEGVRCSCEDE